MNFEVINTEDGSSSIFLPHLDETYHSKFGAINEARHVFINNGLSRINKQEIKICEIGFGTGLNALLSLEYAKSNNLKINYLGVEKNPIPKDIWSKLNYGKICNNQSYFEKLHSSEWTKTLKISDNFSLKKMQIDVLSNDFDLPNGLDIIYFDAFAPSKQLEMWNVNLFAKLHKSLLINGLLVTYASAGVVKQSLRQSGFKVKRLSGPKGKFHMLLASTIDNF